MKGWPASVGVRHTLEQLHRDFECSSVPLQLQAAEVCEEGVEAPLQELLIAVKVRDRRLKLVDLPYNISMLSKASAHTQKTMRFASMVPSLPCAERF